MIDKKINYTLSKQDIKKIEELLSIFGSDAPKILSILFETLYQLIDQKFIVNARLWNKNKTNKNFLNDFLNSVFKSNKNWTNEKILKKNATHFLFDINTYYHNFSSTKGGNKYFKIVAREQQGEYCVMCGSTENLEVDHIKPVRRGGSKESITNMQLLCSNCNGAKNDNINNLLPDLLHIQLSSDISKKIRYRILNDNAQQNQVRNIGLIGVCQMCGVNASQRNLHVVLDVPHSAANYPNLIIVCEECLKRGK
jgi:5-methylcytosine-specific restriction endonuclease McrA